jgi:hypothetical protein
VRLSGPLLSRRAVLAAGASLLPASAAAFDKRNVTVYREPARYGGWPANHGVWAWGAEVVVGFTGAWYKPVEGGHAIDRDKPTESWQARSLDSGDSWKVEKSTLPPESVKPAPLREPLDFTARDFALRFGLGNIQVGPSWFYVSTDRGRSWSGPYAFAVEGIGEIATRTDYLVLGKRECVMFGSAAKANHREGRVFCASTSDGGLTWKLLSLIGPEPAGFMIMPSTARLSDSRWLTTIRHKDPDKQGSIDAYLTEDAGRTWRSLGEAAPAIGGGNPPALLKLRDGRLALTYGYRARPWGVRARLSADQGQSWSNEIVLRDDALNGDLGYPRAIERPDGRVLSIYYFNGPKDEDRTIQATIWRPPS